MAQPNLIVDIFFAPHFNDCVVYSTLRQQKNYINLNSVLMSIFPVRQRHSFLIIFFSLRLKGRDSSKSQLKFISIQVVISHACLIEQEHCTVKGIYFLICNFFSGACISSLQHPEGFLFISPFKQNLLPSCNRNVFPVTGFSFL